MSNYFKYDKVRKTIKTNGKTYRGVELDYFVNTNTFDKQESEFLNYKGLTFIFSNPQGENDDEVHFDINLQYQDAPELEILKKIESRQNRELREEILKDYGYTG